MPTRPPALSEERERLAREIRALLAPHAHHRTFEAVSLLWREGNDSGMLVALESGRVKIFRAVPTGSAVTICLFGPGDVFGLMPFLDGQPYPASAQMLGEATAPGTATPTDDQRFAGLPQKSRSRANSSSGSSA